MQVFDVCRADLIDQASGKPSPLCLFDAACTLFESALSPKRIVDVCDVIVMGQELAFLRGNYSLLAPFYRIDSKQTGHVKTKYFGSVLVCQRLEAIILLQILTELKISETIDERLRGDAVVAPDDLVHAGVHNGVAQKLGEEARSCQHRRIEKTHPDMETGIASGICVKLIMPRPAEMEGENVKIVKIPADILQVHHFW